jgi:hypothetical protein
MPDPAGPTTHLRVSAVASEQPVAHAYESMSPTTHTIALTLDACAVPLLLIAFTMRARRVRSVAALYVHTGWSKSEGWFVMAAFACLALGLYLDGDFPIVT